MLFPFESVREGQKELMEDVMKCLENKMSLIANAPSGVGKTAATLAPSLEYAIKNGKTVFFLTPKHSQHKIVIDTIRKIRERFNVNILAIDIIGKKWLCQVSGVDFLTTQDFNEYCLTLKKNERCIFYNNTREKGELSERACEIIEEIIRNQPLHAEELKSLCKNLCPYEIALEVAKKANLIVCDYYHIFSWIREKLFARTKKSIEDSIIIVDEAHNLPDRIRNILSAKLTTRTIRNALKEAYKFGFEDVGETISKIEDIMINLAKKSNEEEFFISKDDLTRELETIDDYYKIIEDFEIAAIEVREERKRSFIGSIARFLDMWQNEDEGYTRILKKEKEEQETKISLNYICLDPRILSKDIMIAHSIILMSGTLTPMHMYKDLLGFEENTICKSYKSCFPRENRLNIIISDVTTEFKKRNEENLRKISDYIVEVSSIIDGNMAAFFPSYELRDKIYYMIRERLKDRKIFIEVQNSSKEEKMKLFNDFMNSSRAILLGTQAGSFSEGVDFFGGVLKCVIIVGLSLSQPNLETKALIDYYDKKFGKGREYGYVYPAIHRALQSAGRCIRKESDYGVAIFMDKRFLWKNYRLAFPSDIEFKITTNPKNLIEDFFKSKKWK
ncbi:MAG: ATP-dependent DNA helicase [Candidatus Aenigmatarchaeota archaeon]|nr:ATP-dependent DNA helicase [Candidatus Aenigmarchaeota archaeon]